MDVFKAMCLRVSLGLFLQLSCAVFQDGFGDVASVCWGIVFGVP